jgi:TetR/AcrR family transcriptional regulator
MPARVGSAVEVLTGRGVPRAQVVEIQRSRLLAAAVGCLGEVGYARTTVKSIADRARVSRRTFYEQFADCDECLAAVLEDVLGAVAGELEGAGLEGLVWRERVRRGLWAILSFLDRERALARVCVVEALRGGPVVSGSRAGILARLAAVVDEGRGEGARGGECTPLTAEGLVGAAFTILHARLSRGERRPLTDLQGELMGMIVLPYLGAAAARREHTRATPVAHRGAPRGRVQETVAGVDPLGGLTMRLTYRTARVLEGVGEHPGASNRQVSDYAGITDPGQVSKLLRRLERLGLLTNTGAGHLKGEPNAWTLTAKGEQLARNIRAHSAPRERRAA